MSKIYSLFLFSEQKILRFAKILVDKCTFFHFLGNYIKAYLFVYLYIRESHRIRLIVCMLDLLADESVQRLVAGPTRDLEVGAVHRAPQDASVTWLHPIPSTTSS